MEPKSKIWYLDKFNFFSDLTPDQRNFLCKSSVMRTIKKGEVIYSSGDASVFVYFLKEGKVRISRLNDNGNEIIVALLNPGEIFGESCLTNQGKRGEMAIAEDDIYVCTLGERDMKELMRLNFELNLKVFQTIGLRSKKIEKRLEDLSFKDNKTRIRYFLREAALEYGIKNGEEIEIDNFHTHETISKLTSTTRQNVTTVFNDLKSQQIINYDRSRKMVIKDIQRL